MLYQILKTIRTRINEFQGGQNADRYFSLSQGGSKHGQRTSGISYEDCYAREISVSSAISVCDN